MRVADLQKFVRNQARFLAEAGAKTVAADFDRVADALHPFGELSVAQFGDFLERAETFARTGAVPTAGKGARKKAATPADSAQKAQNAAQRVLALYERAVEPALSYAAIDQEIQALGKSLSKDEAIQVARDVGILQALKTKKAALDQMARKISERKESYERIQFRAEPAAAGSDEPTRP